MADGDYYATYAEVQQRFMNAGLATAGNTLYDDDAVELALLTSTALIHAFIYNDNTTTLLTGNYGTICKAVQLDMVMMRALQSRHMQENNLSSASEIQSFWSVMPAFTFFHKEMLNIVKQNAVSQTYNGDVRNGVLV